MFLEKRKSGKSIKYYVVYSFRDEHNKVIKLRRYLGTNLSEKQLEKLSKRAEELLEEQAKGFKTDVFNFSLTNKQLQSLNKFDEQIKVFHLSEQQWRQFTEAFVYNTNAIEGSAVLPDEVPIILKSKEAKDDEERETKGVAKAIDFIRSTKQDVSVSLILKLHQLCFEGSKSFAGKLRDVEVVIRGRGGEIIHRGSPAIAVEKELKELAAWYKKNKQKFKPLVLAAIMHNQFEDIHPFQDGNGRVGRLLLNYVLLQHNYPPINILFEDRAEYYSTLQEYQKNDKLRPTMQFLIKQYKKTLKQVRKK
ncbi:Fic family protein [Candidatus Woesearchaeota archaeon]|nr:Fic family protein [Candidatus Woesearchaeota archaeon]